MAGKAAYSLMLGVLFASMLVLSSCQEEQKTLPPDFPLARDAFPPDATFHSIYYGEALPVNIDKVELPAECEGLEEEALALMDKLIETTWCIVFTSIQSAEECQQHLEQFCKGRDYRYVVRPARPSRVQNMGEFRFFIAPDQSLTIGLMYGRTPRLYYLLVFEDQEYSSLLYEEASPIE